ncbi:T9SS type A sorting domain-containing protein [Neolewinella agarilytica]|uniref:Por secretion system C-terminal sorting domain-containing protein n=1 Tax=Neolewinella agarilytica TaxID=478744 RepID=A0A1H9FSL7_9BACT|nr:T9SS type A sorting domain-containing protein [Neolewinella agarilytica]SEQ40887.1 Por secretion system C-terminal sorting domain-containing protein [Neolewinella agarilytica]
MLVRIASLLCFLFVCQLFLPAQECLEQRVEVEDDKVNNLSTTRFFQSTNSGSVLISTNAFNLSESRLIHWFDKDLNVLASRRYFVGEDGEIADIQARASGGYLGVINTPSFQNRFSFYRVFLAKDASSPDDNIVYTSDSSDAPMAVKNILSVQDSILFLSGIKYGEFGVAVDSTFVEKRINNQMIWRHVNRGGVLLGLDGDGDQFNLLVARDNDIEVVTMSGETGWVENSYSISLTGYRFAPSIFRDVEQNSTYLARFADPYELSKYNSTGLEWTYKKTQTLTSDWIDRITDVDFDEEGFIYVNGIFYNEENSSGVLLTKLSPEGELIWEKRYDNEGELWAASRYSMINEGIIYLTGEKSNQAGAWNQFVAAFSLQDGQLLKECSENEISDQRFTSAGIKFHEGNIYTFGDFNDRVEPVLSLRSFDFSDLTSSNEEASPLVGMNIKVYPNPADHRGQLLVEIPLPHQLSHIHIASVNGKEVAAFTLSANQSILQINDLLMGTYVVYARDQAGAVVMERRVVVR